jgi:hypothetical protein
LCFDYPIHKVKVQIHSFLTSALYASDKHHASAAVPLGKEPRYLVYRRLGQLQIRSGQAWRKEKSLALTGVRIPDHPARGESLY